MLDIRQSKRQSDLDLNYIPGKGFLTARREESLDQVPWSVQGLPPAFLLSQYALDSRSLGFPGSLYEATLQYHVEFTRPGSGAGNHPYGLPA